MLALDEYMQWDAEGVIHRVLKTHKLSHTIDVLL